jgi:NAD(P)-dependent dehydrogenase (short-subunit alcohol dehydrogenase family)
MSSIARHGNRGQSNYSAAKAALATNTKTWALEFAAFGIRVGAIAPGMIETPMTAGMNQKARDALVGAIPVGPHRRARGHLARREVRARVRLLQRPHHRRRRRPLHVIRSPAFVHSPRSAALRLAAAARRAAPLGARRATHRDAGVAGMPRQRRFGRVVGRDAATIRLTLGSSGHDRS